MRACVVLCLWLLSAVASAEQVRGRALDARAKPLEGAAVEVLRKERLVAKATVDGSGSFAFELRPGAYVLRFSHPSLCETSTHELALRRGEDAAPNLILPRCVALTGAAFDRAGAALAGGTVELWSELDPQWLTAPVDAEGRFNLPRVRQGGAQVRIYDAAGVELPAQVKWTAPHVLEVRATAQRLLHVSVLDASGEPLSGADVTLVPLRPASEFPERIAGLKGRVSFPMPAEGRYRLLVTWSEMERVRRVTYRDVEVARGEEDQDVEVRFPPVHTARISGVVRTPDGRPVAGARIEAEEVFTSLPLDDEFLSETTNLSEQADAKTDREGRFELVGLRPVDYRLSVSDQSGAREQSVRAGTGEPVELRLGRGCTGRVTGQVVSPTGEPVTTYSIRGRQQTHPQGKFEVRDECVFHIAADGFLPHQVRLDEPLADHVDLGRIVLEAGRLLEGRLLDATGTALAGVPLAWWPESGGGPRTSVVTSADGTFSIREAPTREGVVVRMAQEGALFAEFTWRVAAGGDVRSLELRVPTEEVLLDVRVVDGSGKGVLGLYAWAEGVWGRRRAITDAAGRTVLRVPRETVTVRVSTDTATRPDGTRVARRFERQTLTLTAGDRRSVLIRGTSDGGRLRVVLPRATHYNDVCVQPGDVPGPSDLERDEVVWEHCLSQDPSDSAYFRAALTDFSGLRPGRYTVFASRSYGDDELEAHHFRQVVEVSGNGRQVVTVRFEKTDPRTSP